MAVASPEQKARHYLVIGPWDHAGTHAPRPEVGGVKFGPASLVDIPKLHVDWYDWTLAGGPRPEFLKGAVAYYVMGAETWRYAASLDAVTAELRPCFLDSAANANRIASPGALDAGHPGKGAPDHYVYDPRDVSTAGVEAGLDPSNLRDQTLLQAQDGRELVYETPAFDRATEISGVFKLSAWIALDQPDTDFRVTVYEVARSGESILLTSDQMRARYRESLRKAVLVTTRAPLLYSFDRFTFVSRRIAAGARLRLVIAPINSINSEKNYSSGKPVAEETLQDARPVTVTLAHDKAHPSALYVPFGRPDGE
jgi:putative CocE/NonD family hydrolase